MSQTLSCEVLIVGLGPVGAVLAALLCDAGVEVIAIDKSTEVYPLPRAAHFDHEIMRVFQQVGIAEEALRHARSAKGYEFRSASGEVLARFGRMDEPTSSGWASSYMFNQPGLERALRARLARSPRARLMLGAAFRSLQARAEGVEAEIETDQGPLRVDAAFLIGCDGASSPVRDSIGGQLQDLQFDEPWLVIDTIPGPAARLPEVNLQICDPARPTTCVLMGPGRHRWEFMILPGETSETVMDDAFIAERLAPWGGDLTIERKAVYRFHGLVADRWRSGPVLIAGDAAHQTPPFAGQGMCAGIRDAANLAWKLAAVLRGQARESLLDSYQTEREPNVRAYIQLAIQMGRVVCALDPAQAKARDAQMLAARAAGVAPIPPASPPPMAGPCILEGTAAAGQMLPQPIVQTERGAVRLDDALGAGPWLICRGAPASAIAGLRAIDLHDPALAPFSTALAAWLNTQEAEAVLVRPDRYVFGTGAPDRLADAWTLALKGAAPIAETAGQTNLAHQ